MPLKLKPPRQGKTPYYSVRGTHLRIYVDRSTGTADRKAADRIRRRWTDEIERGEYADSRALDTHENIANTNAAPTTPQPVTFLGAAIAYMKAGGDRKRLGPIIKHAGPGSIRDLPVDRIDQLAIDNAADDLFPNATPQTKNREFYTPVAAVLHRAGIERRIKRPVGWKGSQSTSWLEPNQAFRLFAEADAIDREFGLVVRFLLYTGLRLGEALNARLRDLHLSERTSMCRIPKRALPDPYTCRRFSWRRSRARRPALPGRGPLKVRASNMASLAAPRPTRVSRFSAAGQTPSSSDFMPAGGSVKCWPWH